MEDFDSFGDTDSRKMPSHLFWGVRSMDHSTAVRANIKKQNFSVCPRHWYVDAEFECDGCGQRFSWPADEQRVWFEEYNFWIESRPRNCKKCNGDRKHLLSLRKEYDSSIAEARSSKDPVTKLRMIEILAELTVAGVTMPERMTETKLLFEHQIQEHNRRQQNKS
jgi:hypothetical protein